MLKFLTKHIRDLSRVVFAWSIHKYGSHVTGLEKLGFLVNETPCSSKQVQEHVVPLVILCSL